jgi:hypothetical protein
MQANEIRDGLDDYAAEREEQDARAALIDWAVEALDTNDGLEDAGYGAYVRQQLTLAQRRARAAGVFDDQPDEALWLTMHRRER